MNCFKDYKAGETLMSDNYSLSVGCIVRKNNEIPLVRHTYGSAAGKFNARYPMQNIRLYRRLLF